MKQRVKPVTVLCYQIFNQIRKILKNTNKLTIFVLNKF